MACPWPNPELSRRPPRGGTSAPPPVGGQEARKQWMLQSGLNECELRHGRVLLKHQPQVCELRLSSDHHEV